MQTGTLLPSLQAVGRYTQNQYNVAFAFSASGPALAVTPTNQWDAIFTLNVPLVDLRAFSRNHAAHLQADAAQEDRRATGLAVERQVVAAYYQFAGSIALVQSTRSALAAARDNLQASPSRSEPPASPPRSTCSKPSPRSPPTSRAWPTGELQRELSRRQLTTLTGVTPNDEVAPDPGTASSTTRTKKRRSRRGRAAEGRRRLGGGVAAGGPGGGLERQARPSYALVPALSAVRQRSTSPTPMPSPSDTDAFYAICPPSSPGTWTFRERRRRSRRRARLQRGRQGPPGARCASRPATTSTRRGGRCTPTSSQSKAAEARSKAAHLAADLAKDRYAEGRRHAARGHPGQPRRHRRGRRAHPGRRQPRSVARGAPSGDGQLARSTEPTPRTRRRR